ncbi:OmpP1/FadL family transporter [Aestuariispira insulae]|uniref:Long-chain fatty acid transport protein n=1 Tax=Aestuariispira insulae TaxID=1461337 RepID=A0A3D9H591_9PROT|nr:outer membrane protein transport protein [Aestuariispira insulae]RED44664.1 long-chain fatty acid transport protein [Aestuariispira insulae]
MSQNMLKWGAATAVIGAVLVASNFAHAAGYQLKEQGAALQGTSFAGATAKGGDMSTLFFNPAGMAQLEGNQFEVNASVISTHAEFSLESVSGGNGQLSTSGNGGDAGDVAVVPSTYAMWDINDEWNVGIAINTPFGLKTEYEDGWVGRYHALKSELMTVTINPVFSYKVNDKLSIGGGPLVQYIEGELSKNINFSVAGGSDGKSILSADDIGYGFSAGFQYDYSNDTRIGFSYRSSVDHRLKGNIDIQGTVPGAFSSSQQFKDARAHADVKTPDIASLGVYHKVNDQWAVMGDVAYTNWSVFNELRVIDDSGTQRELVDENWEDTLFLSIGTEYQVNDALNLQFGVAYDQSAVSQKDLTFRIPDADRLWVSAGIGYQFSEDTSLNLGYTHIFADDVTVTEDETNASTVPNGQVTGTYDSSVDILAVNFAMKF